jgi:hypothetical protein
MIGAIKSVSFLSARSAKQWNKSEFNESNIFFTFHLSEARLLCLFCELKIYLIAKTCVVFRQQFMGVKLTQKVTAHILWCWDMNEYEYFSFFFLLQIEFVIGNVDVFFLMAVWKWIVIYKSHIILSRVWNVLFMWNMMNDNRVNPLLLRQFIADKTVYI